MPPPIDQAQPPANQPMLVEMRLLLADLKKRLTKLEQVIQRDGAPRMTLLQFLLRIGRYVLQPLAWLSALVVFALVVSAGVRWSWEARKPPTTLPTPSSPAAAELKKQIDDVVDARIKYDQALIDKLVVLVGIYTTILSFLALGTVLLNRQDAKEQLKTGKDSLDKLQEEARARLGEFEQQIRRDVPEIHRLHERILEIMSELQRILPDEADWNDNESFRGLPEATRQEVLLAEYKVASLAVFNLEQSPMQRAALGNIDRALARFYIARHNTAPDHSEADYERARFYATQSIRLEPDLARAYRLRGAIAIGRYDGISASATGDAKRLLLDDAEVDLRLAISFDTPDSADAGAHYNDAIVHFYRGNLDRAAQSSAQAIALKARFSSVQRKKYLPDIYVNYGCYLARKAAATAAGAEKDRLCQKVIQVFQEGVVEFRQTEPEDGPTTLLKGMVRELTAPSGDLSTLDPVWRKGLTDLHADLPGALAAAQNEADAKTRAREAAAQKIVEEDARAEAKEKALEDASQIANKARSLALEAKTEVAGVRAETAKIKAEVARLSGSGGAVKP